MTAIQSEPTHDTWSAKTRMRSLVRRMWTTDAPPSYDYANQLAPLPEDAVVGIADPSTAATHAGPDSAPSPGWRRTLRRGASTLANWAGRFVRGGRALATQMAHGARRLGRQAAATAGTAMAHVRNGMAQAYQAVRPDGPRTWRAVLGHDRVFRIRYGANPVGGQRAADYCASVHAFYRELDGQRAPIHIGEPPSGDARLAQSRGPIRYHAQVAKDFEREPNQALTVRGGPAHPIAASDRPYHLDVADALYQAAAGERWAQDDGAEWNPQAVRQRIALALHTRTQTFDADIAKHLVDSAGSDLERATAVKAMHMSHRYQVVGHTLHMTKYLAYRQRQVCMQTGAEDATLILARRAGAIDLRTGELADDTVHLSEPQPLAPTTSRMTRSDGLEPWGARVVDFDGFGRVAVHIAELATAKGRRAWFSAQDLDR